MPAQSAKEATPGKWGGICRKLLKRGVIDILSEIYVEGGGINGERTMRVDMLPNAQP